MTNTGNLAQKTTAYDRITDFLLPVFAVVALAAAVWRMLAPEAKTLEGLDSTTLLYLGVAGALLLLRDVKTLAFGDYKVEFERVKEIAQTAQAKAENAQTKAENAQTVALGVGKDENPSSPAAKSAALETVAGAVLANADPWKGKFGGANEANRRRLSAQVTRVAGSNNLFSIKLKVYSLAPEQAPLGGVVQFFLHPTFNNDRPVISVGANAAAELKLTAWGAFTVGAVADGGQTRLELDLSQLSDAPAEFRGR